MPQIFDKDGFIIVKETYSCHHFEPVPGQLLSMKECWYCKWADFHKEVNNGKNELSVCRYVSEEPESEPEDEEED